MKGSLKIARVAGIKVYLHWTFALLIIYLIVSNYMRGYSAAQIAWSIGFVMSIFITVVLHELGHALTARLYKINTTDITLLPIGGLARLERLPEKPSEELKVALAGPAVNIVLALIARIFIEKPDEASLQEAVSTGVSAGNFLLNFYIVNLWLAIFNLIPAFPMDGGRVLRALLAIRLQRHVATNIAATVGKVLAVGFVIIGLYSNPFLMFIGFFIFLGAQAEAQHVTAQAMLRPYKLKDVIMKEIPALQAGDTVKKAAELLLKGQNKNFVVMEEGKEVGTLGRDEIIRGLAEHGEQESVRNIMNSQLLILSGEIPLEQAYMQMSQKKPPLLLVKSNGVLEGVVDHENIVEFILLQKAVREAVH